MGNGQRFPVGFPPVVRDVIRSQVGVLGNSEAEVVKNIVLMYFTEKELFQSYKKGGKR